MRAATFPFSPLSPLLSHLPFAVTVSLLFFSFLFSSSSGQTLQMRRLLPSYQFNNRTELFLAVLPQPLQYFAPNDPTNYTSGPHPIIQYHAYPWWPSYGGGIEFNDTYLIDASNATPTTVPVTLISGSDVQTTGYNYTTGVTSWGPTFSANPLNGNSPSLDCIASVGCSSRTTGIIYLFGGFAPYTWQHRFSMDGGKTWNNSAVDLQLFPGNGQWGLADPRCEVDPISGQVLLFSGLVRGVDASEDLVNIVWSNPGGGDNTTDPTLWTVQCASAPWPARTDASSTIWYSSKMGHSIVWIANGHQVPFQFGQEVVINSSVASGYTVVSPGTNDIWTSPNLGLTWDLVTLAAPYLARTGSRLAASDSGTLVLAEGSADYSDISDTYPHDVWASADGGVTWGLCLVNSTSYAARRSFGMAIDHSGYLWFSSGQYDVKSKEPADDNADILVSEMSFDDPVALETKCGITVSPCGIGARCYPVTSYCPCYISSSSTPTAPSSVSSSTRFSSSAPSSSPLSSSVLSSSAVLSSSVPSSSSALLSSVSSSPASPTSLPPPSPSSLHSSSPTQSSSALSSSLSLSSSPMSSSPLSSSPMSSSPMSSSPIPTAPVTASSTVPFNASSTAPSTSLPTSPFSSTGSEAYFTSSLFPTSSSSTGVAPPAPPTSPSSSFPVGAIIGIVVGVVLGCCLCLVLLFVCFRRRKGKEEENGLEVMSPRSTLSPKGSTPSTDPSRSSNPRFSGDELELGRALPSVGSSFNSFPSGSAFVSGGAGDSEGSYRTQDLTAGGSEELHLSSVVYVH